MRPGVLGCSPHFQSRQHDVLIVIDNHVNRNRRLGAVSTEIGKIMLKDIRHLRAGHDLGAGGQAP